MSLIIKNLSKSYFQDHNEIQILNNLNLEIQSGEVFSLIGPSGSGKSTFLSLIAGLDQPDRGNILVDQTDITKLTTQEMTQFRGKNMGFVFQQYHLIPHLTALENVMIPLEILKYSDGEQKAKNILELVGLSHRLNHLPTQLSGGECQRVAIARALVVEPKILLADEPSGNLDEKTGEKVMDLFFELAALKKTTALVVTHSLTLARRCKKIFELKHGQLEKVKE